MHFEPAFLLRRPRWNGALSAAALAVAVLGVAAPSLAQSASGAHDFDWEFGRWETTVRVRAPLSAAEDWQELTGTSDVRPLSKGRANVVELEVAGRERRIEGLSLRLFDPQTGQWSLNFANIKNGLLTSPVYGGFADGRGVFFGQDTVDGRFVSVRFIITRTQTTAHFEQAYSADGGQSWLVNWVADDVRKPG